VGDIGNGLGVLSDVLPPPAKEVASVVATGLGLGALGGHALAKAAGADVSTETLTFDLAGAATSLAGLAEVLPDAVIKGATYGLLVDQGIGERVGGKDFESPVDDFRNYWVPKDMGQAAVVAGTLVAGPAPWAAVALGNAADAGMQADNAPARQRERAEDEVWN
jgi:hypothetical protein